MSANSTSIGRIAMKMSILGASAACLALATPSAQTLATEPVHDHAAHAGAPAPSLSERAQKATTPAARSRLMQENMAAMKARMADMHAMMEADGMMAAKPMAMDSDQMAKMHKHMMMMQDMMEGLMVQQELMMRPKK